MARGNPPKSTNWSTQSGTRQPTKKHELEHAKWHEATHQKARTGARKMARGNPPKSTNWSTQNGTRQPTKKHELAQNGKRQPTKSTRNSCRESKKVGHVKNRYTQIIPLKSPIASSQEKQFALCTFWGVPIWKSFFWTVTGIRIDSNDNNNNTNNNNNIITIIIHNYYPIPISNEFWSIPKDWSLKLWDRPTGRSPSLGSMAPHLIPIKRKGP